jgi:hypothetical protein
MPVSSATKVTARVLWIIGARGTSFDTTVEDDRFILEEIQRAIVETESELVHDLCEASHPSAISFQAWSADITTNGDKLPERIGKVEAIQIKPVSGGTYAPAESTSRDNIRAWRNNHNDIFDAVDHNASGSNLAGYFNITGDTLEFTGYSAQARIYSYTPNYTPTLQIDDNFEGALIAGAITRLNKMGVPQGLVMHYGQQYTTARTLIRQGQATMPKLNEVQAVA